MKIRIIIFTIIIVSCNYSCHSQYSENCNSQTTDKGWEKKIGDGVCIRDGYSINYVDSNFDYNMDGIDDLAVRYTIYPIEDGNKSYHALFKGLGNDKFKFVKEFTSLSVPTIKTMTSDYYKNHPIADSLAEKYPIERTIEFEKDTLVLSMKISIEFGKTYFFTFNSEENAWILKKYEFWLGQIPGWYIQNMQLDSDLISNKRRLEVNKVVKQITVDEFNLPIEYEVAKNQDAQYLESKYDIYEIGSKN